jgi:hypothetical protein
LFVANVPQCTLRVRVQRKERVLAERRLQQPLSNPQPCDLVVDEPLAVRGTLVDANGVPLAKWRVRAEAEGDGETDEVVADDRGAFACHGSGNGPLRVVVGPGQDLLRERHTFTDIARGADGLRLVVPAEALPDREARVRVVDEQQEPVAAAVAYLLSPAREPFEPVGPPQEGVFRFAGLAPGDFTLELHAPGRAARSVHVVVRADGANDFGDQVLTASAVLRVRPRQADGSRWPGWMPRPEVRDSGGELLQLYYGGAQDGDALVYDWLPPGRFLLVANGYSNVLTAPLPIELRAGAVTEVDWIAAVGLSIEFTFPVAAGTKPAPDDAPKLTLRDAEGHAVALQGRAYPGDTAWSLHQTFAMGSYDLDASDRAGHRWHAAFAVRDLQNDPNRIEVPLQR